MKVNHPQFGNGTVISKDDTNVTVDFNNGVIKTLMIKFSKLTTEEGTPFGEVYVAPKPKSKKRNPANFDRTLPSWNDMSAEEKYKFELERESAKYGSHSTFY